MTPKYGVCPSLVIVVVSRTGRRRRDVTVGCTSDESTKLKPRPVTVAPHRGSVLPDGQLLPAAAEVTVVARILSAGVRACRR